MQTTVFPFTTRLLPELFKMQELVDHQELSDLAKTVLMATSSVVYPLHLVRPTLDALMGLLRTSESWRIRLDVLPVLQGGLHSVVEFKGRTESSSQCSSSTSSTSSQTIRSMSCWNAFVISFGTPMCVPA